MWYLPVAGLFFPCALGGISICIGIEGSSLMLAEDLSKASLSSSPSCLLSSSSSSSSSSSFYSWARFLSSSSLFFLLLAAAFAFWAEFFCRAWMFFTMVNCKFCCCVVIDSGLFCCNLPCAARILQNQTSQSGRVCSLFLYRMYQIRFKNETRTLVSRQDLCIWSSMCVQNLEKIPTYMHNSSRI